MVTDLESGAGGARIRASLDGRTVAEASWPARSGGQAAPVPTELAFPVAIDHPGGRLRLATPRISRHAAVVLTR
jgi:hypothetical protein